MPSRRVTFCAYDEKGSLGGPQSWLLRLLPGLIYYGIEIRVLCMTWGPEEGSMLGELRSQGITCDTTQCMSDTEGRITWIIEQVRLNPPDVLVVNLVTPAWYAARWLQDAGIPCVGVMHSDDIFYLGLREVFVTGKREFRLSHVIGVSELIEELLISATKNTQIRRIPYGVPIPSKTVSREASGLRLAYVGRFAEEQKQISAHARALCTVVREVRGTSAVLYGDGPDRPNLERILAEEGRGLPIRIGGRIPSSAIQEVLLKCDVLVLLSDYEGLPIALLEAMACGCVPVCLKMRSGIPELVVDGVTGILVENREKDFVSAIRLLSEEPELWKRLSTAARMKIESDFSVDLCNQRWADFLLKVAPLKSRQQISIPSKIKLPPVHPALAAEDYRPQTETLPAKLFKRLRIIAGLVHRKILKSYSRPPST